MELLPGETNIFEITNSNVCQAESNWSTEYCYLVNYSVATLAISNVIVASAVIKEESRLHSVSTAILIGVRALEIDSILIKS